MTAFELEIILWYATRPNDWCGPAVNTDLYKITINDFVSKGLLCSAEPPKKWCPTPKLHAFFEALKLTPLPVCSWIDPRDGTSLTKSP